MNTLQRIIMAGCLIIGLVTAAHAANKVNGSINFQGDTVHLEFTGQQNWDYDVKRLEVKGQTVVEMAVPALDDSTIQALSAFKSEFVTGIVVDRQGPDGKSVVKFTLAGENIDTFDYLTDQPSRLIMDFYLNPNAKKEVPAVAKKSEPAAVADKAKSTDTVAKVKTNKKRNPATADVLALSNQGIAVAANDEAPIKAGIFDGGDPEYDRFAIKDYQIKEDAIIRAKDNYYIPFPMLQTPVSFWEKLKVTPTIYQITPKATEENKQARLLLTLFEKQRYAVYLKTQAWFKEKYPNSEYNEMIDFMTADVHLSLWQNENRGGSYDEAMQRYKDAIAKYPQSPLAERTSLKTGFLSLEKGDAINALRLFNDHIENKNFGAKNSLSKDLARVGTGLAFMKINKWNDAAAQFAEVEKNTQNRDLKVEAAFRQGDIWARAKNYDKAVAEYQAALKKYPEGQNFYPNAFYNQAESLFWMKKYPESLDVYRTYIKKFPSDDHAAFAMTRMGELLDIFGADKSRVMGAYLETFFRYGESPSAVVARLRLLSARMKGMKPKEVNHAVGEIMSLAKKIDLPNIEQFSTVMVGDGYTSRGEFPKSIDLLSKYYKEHPTSVDVPLMTNRIVANINEKLSSEVAQGNFIAALKTHSKFADNWLKNSKRLDTKYNVGRAFEMGGAPVEAEKYYKDVLNRIYAIRGTQEAKEIKAKENLPSEDELNLRLSAVFTNEQKYNQAYEFLKNIKNPETLTEEAQIERVNIAVRLLEKRGDNESAIRYLGELLRTWKGQPELVAEPYLKLAELQMKQNRSADALQALGMIDKLQSDSDKVSPVVHAKALEMTGDIQLEKGQPSEAIASYEKLLEKYEDKRPLSSIRYKLGQIHFNKGEIQKAATVWNEFKGEKSEFWKNLAQEQLKNSEWRDGYKKYIKRIPAMSENEQGK
ncbi:tetratricopeptide repeat protein [Bdellovibrio reynosensis]|uniref:Tetratricopeptide repeat protein n=1 Tax=Bdellovibrio reynosensis TaxID=2835041 RepID=A0ABY4C7G1_9BACT|nr:tetratricopeptide repeat protein [Bdellovibrio reynosensis]UOF00855.1 tetratricopeptide repeat protein [Bdellovibrio reynosensis]